MEIENIKTKIEFYEFFDIWYHRANILRDIWQNIIETNERREKAFKLWLIMYYRIMKLVPIAIKINQPKNIYKFESSGMIVV